MVPIKVGDIADALKGELVAGDPEAVISSVCADSRVIQKGDLFIPLKGTRFDGHRFIDAAIDGGAAVVLLERLDEGLAVRLRRAPTAALKVGDTQAALTALAHLIRGRLTAKVIGITGSTGKTSTKDILAALTGRSLNTLATPRNDNNEIGAPLTITKAKLETEVLVIEMGMRGPGQIAALAAMARPEIGIITNIGLTHVGLLGSQKKIAATKAELIESLPADGYAILNSDDDWTEFLRERTKAKVLTFGIKPGAFIGASDISLDEYARPSWRLVIDGRPGPVVRLSAPGRHNVINALAAIAAARLVGVGEADIIDGLSKVRLTDMRLAIIETKKGVTIINDVYNANPASMSGALETLKQVKPGARHVAVLGQMSELGEDTIAAHRGVGVEVAGLGVDMLVTVGEHADKIAEAAVEAGMSGSAVTWLGTKEETVVQLKNQVEPGDVVLVKGSRIAGLEDVVYALLGEK
ncbi:MAG: UDP-N-acetylmuramoyl-tripeptide--D-alanyl-D-alanine ligase [Actinomycetota bacterium]|nr:UDP-N-acetylmuramoyl-tripeptide--D-alanyl-D-alanine ligase [Actinomycetota bacterium]